MKNDSGFTLVDILISLTLFSVILVLVFSALYTSNKSWIASVRQIEANEEQRIVLTFIKRHLSQMTPILRLDGKENNLVFKGEENSIHFVSSLPAHRGGGGLYLLTLQLDKDLILRYQIVTTDIDFETEPYSEKVKSQILISDIEDIKFSYFGSEKRNDVPGWHGQWKDKKRLPDLISLLITSKNSTHYWPEVLIPVHTQTITGQPQFTLQNKKTASRI